MNNKDEQEKLRDSIRAIIEERLDELKDDLEDKADKYDVENLEAALEDKADNDDFIDLSDSVDEIKKLLNALVERVEELEDGSNS